jgi:hypothetical protein
LKLDLKPGEATYRRPLQDMFKAAAEKDEGFDRMDEFRRDMNQTSPAECTTMLSTLSLPDKIVVLLRSPFRG